MHPKTTVKQAGFTLIELLVVIAIISILASMLMPVFARARAKARQTACVSNVKQIVLAIKMYIQDADEQLPFGLNGGGTFWHGAIYSYTHNKQILRCPDRKDRYVGYGFNYLCSGISEGAFFDAASKIVIGDVPPECLGVTNSSAGSEWWVNDPGNDICGVPGDAVGTMVSAGTEDAENNNFSAIGRPQRHNDGCNWGYADGHAKWGREEGLDQAAFWNPTTVTD